MRDTKKKSAHTLAIFCGCAVYCFLVYLHPVWNKLYTDTATRLFDTEIFVWSLHWWAHCLFSEHNPFFMPFLMPRGQWLVHITNVPFYGLLMAPITFYQGAVFSYNLALWGALSLDFWAAYLLFQYFSNRIGLALFFAGAFMNSGYIWFHLSQGHLNLLSFYPLLLMGYFSLRFYRKQLTRKQWISTLSILSAIQYLCSIELMLFGAVTIVILALIFLLQKSFRCYWRITLIGFGIAAIIACLLVSPFLIQYLRHPLKFGVLAGQLFALPLSYGIPNNLFLLSFLFGKWTSLFGSGDQMVYFGLPIYCLLLLSLCKWKQDILIRSLGIAIIIIGLFSLGSQWQAEGLTIYLPWRLFSHLPYLSFMGPTRFAFVLNILIVLCILRNLRFVTITLNRTLIWGGMIVIFLLPNTLNWRQTYDYPDSTLPAFFANGEYQHYIKPADRVFMLTGLRSLRMLLQIERLLPQPLHFILVYDGPAVKGAPIKAETDWLESNRANDISNPLTVNDVRSLIQKTQTTIVLLPTRYSHYDYSLISIVLGEPTLKQGGIYLWKIKPKKLDSKLYSS